jgi:hypothetical protein
MNKTKEGLNKKKQQEKLKKKKPHTPCDGVAVALPGSDVGVPALVATVTGVTPVAVENWGVSLAVSEGSTTDGWLGAELGAEEMGERRGENNTRRIADLHLIVCSAKYKKRN